MEDSRLIVYHKQGYSARTLFLRLNDTVCHPKGLPSLSQVCESHIEEGQTVTYPSTLIADTEKQLGLSSGMLEIEGEFEAEVDAPESPIHVYLARCTTTDPPYQQIENSAGKFIALTEARSLPPAELELLRLAYSFVMDD
ncbi:hypothetical protein [Microseira wollei]|uniref:Uncharacterized protein n=1 Tax=Microseira wollei NIES-4236 TaxID=2530354 RepID=A0AAV3XS36_9CYAN|nr:hypothetical protein [Microseira wollei]GET43841.1 hypothetical protein MiSe_86670 [Microseira wollei NIES-4236]